MAGVIRKHRGAQSELIACAWLLDNGYEVFRNISPYGDVDIVAMKEGKIFLFDVKSLGSEVSDPVLTSSQITLGVKILRVDNNDVCRISWTYFKRERKIIKLTPNERKARIEKRNNNARIKREQRDAKNKKYWEDQANIWKTIEPIVLGRF